MEDLFKEALELAIDPNKGLPALVWLVMLNTALGVALALLKKEFKVAKLLDFLGGDRVVLGGLALVFILLGMRAGIPLLVAYQFVAGAIAVSATYDVGAKLVAVVAFKKPA